MKKLIVSCLLMTATMTVVFAQSAKVVSAFNYLKSGDFEQAKSNINEAINDPKTGVQAKTWYYRGAIYEAIYGDTSFRRKNPDALAEAVKSYEKAMEIDPKNQWKSEIQQGLNDCANYAYNDGVAYRFVTDRKDSLFIRNEEASFQFEKDHKAYFPYATDPRSPDRPRPSKPGPGAGPGRPCASAGVPPAAAVPAPAGSRG